MTGQTGPVRIYLPATLLDLAPPVGSPRAVSARRAHAVTPQLREMFPDEDDEGLEYAAHLAAADGSLELLGRTPGAPRLRLVLTADVPADAVRPADDDEAAPSAVEVTGDVPWAAIACAHVDEGAATADVVAALTGDVDAVESLDEHDLLWYDVSELDALTP